MAETTEAPRAKGILPPIGSVKYHLLLGAVAILILGPLGAVTAAYMNFSLGFFVGGQVLAGILGSVVTYGYGAEGKHGANYMQTMAASVASMGAMGVLIQAMVWVGLPIPPAWQLVVYFLCVGMLGVGIGMLYTPLLVDRMQLTYPSGLAVANILRALTDKRLLRRSVGQLGAGTGIGFFLAFLIEKLGVGEYAEKLKEGDTSAAKAGGAVLGILATFEASTLGAGMIVGARIGIPAIVVAVIGDFMTPWLRTHGAVWPDGKVHMFLGPDDEYRKIGFLIALGTIMGAAIVDIFLVFRAAVARFRERTTSAPQAPEDGQNFSMKRLFAWVAFWATATVVAGAVIMKAPVPYLILAVVLAVVFVLINGISFGVSDSNPISAAFVTSVLLMALVGLKDLGVGLLCGAILLVSCSVGCDMQQDRSTGFRLGTNRKIQFRYQVVGVTMGAICAVGITTLFLKAYPVLNDNTYDFAELKQPGWSSTMTFKFVGALHEITNPNPTSKKLLLMGLGIGFVTEIARKLMKASAGYKRFRDGSKTGYVVDFLLDAVFLPSPYASSFGGFVRFPTAMYFGTGGILGSLYATYSEQKRASAAKKDAPAEDLPEDMSTTSLVGGGLIAGESISALTLGIMGLVGTLGTVATDPVPIYNDGDRRVHVKAGDQEVDIEPRSWATVKLESNKAHEATSTVDGADKRDFVIDLTKKENVPRIRAYAARGEGCFAVVDVKPAPVKIVGTFDKTQKLEGNYRGKLILDAAEIEKNEKAKILVMLVPVECAKIADEEAIRALTEELAGTLPVKENAE